MLRDTSTRWARSFRRVRGHPTASELTVVAVVPSPVRSRNEFGTQLGRVASLFLVKGGGWVYKLVDRLPGQYTVSKLDSFEAFQRETSRKKVAAILLFTPVPCLIVNLFMECIPLSDPATGLAGSGFFQLRMFCLGMISALMPSLIKLDCVPESPVSSPIMLLLFAVSQAAIFLITNALISLAADVFPVPLSLFTAVLPMAIAGRLMFYRHLPKDPQFHAQSNKVNLWVTVEMLPLFVYPAFTVGFMALSSTQQFWVSFLLPLLKLVIRRVLWIITKDDYDLINVMTSCVGQLYHVLFIAMALQNSKSLSTMGVITLLGVIRMLLNCRHILDDCKKIQQAKAQLENVKFCSEDKSNQALRVALEPPVASLLHRKRPSLFLSTYPGYRCSDFMTRHKDILREQQSIKTDLWARLASVFPWQENRKSTRPTSVRSLRVVPRPLPQSLATSKTSPSLWPSSAPEMSSSVKRSDYVSSVAVAMHQSEIILLRSYVIIWMSLFYAIYLVAVFWFPNHRYFATQAAMTTFEAVGISVTRLLLLCGMEMVFLGIQLTLIAHRLGVSGIYQLAFVLWSQRVLVQAKTLQLTVDILAFSLVHTGNSIILPVHPANKTR